MSMDDQPTDTEWPVAFKVRRILSAARNYDGSLMLQDELPQELCDRFAEEVQKNIPDERRRREYEANRARLEELRKNANSRASDPYNDDRVYWTGVEFGLRRAMGVLDGKG